MRWNINLASQPYEDARRFSLVWGASLAALAVLTVALLVVAAQSWRTATETRRHIAAERARLAALEQQQQRNLEILNRPENRDVREKSQFLNTLIRRKQFSWTQVFASLEKLMPGRLHVVSINPQLTDDDQILVQVRVAGDTRERAIHLVQNLEKSDTFRLPRVHSETTVEPRAGEPAQVQFEITALYFPEVQAPDTTELKQQAKRGN